MGTVDPNMPVLIVDDYQTMLRTMGNLMRKLGFANIDQASDGHQALRKLSERPYGLVISGWNMAPMSGLDLIRQVRANARLAHLCFVVISSDAAAETLAAAKQAGASEFIVKPFCAATLRVRLAAILGEF